ncbi:unnamed protein product [Spirodela intermedia]|uniref:Uncharacterized protein n=2 Tax=Spirodela intermedia TaxID=51605 RepID=A0A7I8K1A2_SPIIN|nr:unnamed protein product [Spirodela intermedia]CAA6654611.1 unnamed protein product [Spirodela intermedia]CAA7389245.1 unnamed protein product [Spirodela intermedia]
MLTAAMILQTVLCCLLAIPLLLLFCVRRSRKLDLPAPTRLPLIGNLHQLGKLPHHSLHRLANTYGPLMCLELGRVPTLVVSSAEMAKEILKTHDAIFCTRPNRAVVTRFSYGGQGVSFAPYGEGWRQLRKISTLELFTAKRVQSLRPIREEEVRVLVKEIAETATAGQLINISEMVLCLFCNITCRQAFGRRSSNDDECRKSKFHDQIVESIELLAGFSPSDLFPSMGWLNIVTGLHARLQKAFHFFDNLFEEQIEAHLRRDNDDEKDFMSVLLRLQKDTSLGFNLTREQIKSILVETFLGGSDTSASTTEFGMLELILNPRVMKKAQEEVRRVVGTKPMAEDSDIANLPYLNLVVKEILRLHPPLPLSVPHMSLKDVNICGYDIPAKTAVLTNLWAIMRDPGLWKDPEVFWPERFEESDIQYKGQDFHYIPFSSGRRICPGMNLAVTSVQLALANLLYCFDWELADGMKPKDIDTTETVGIVLHLESPLRLKATLAS